MQVVSSMFSLFHGMQSHRFNVIVFFLSIFSLIVLSWGPRFTKKKQLHFSECSVTLLSCCLFNQSWFCIQYSPQISLRKLRPQKLLLVGFYQVFSAWHYCFFFNFCCFKFFSQKFMGKCLQMFFPVCFCFIFLRNFYTISGRFLESSARWKIKNSSDSKLFIFCSF